MLVFIFTALCVRRVGPCKSSFPVCTVSPRASRGRQKNIAVLCCLAPGDWIFPSTLCIQGFLQCQQPVRYSFLCLFTWPASPAFDSGSGDITLNQMQAGSLGKIIVSTFSPHFHKYSRQRCVGLFCQVPIRVLILFLLLLSYHNFAYVTAQFLSTDLN